MIDATKAVVQTTSSRHHIHLPARFNIWATISTGGGDVGTAHI
jgi:hypothetical protein